MRGGGGGEGNRVIHIVGGRGRRRKSPQGISVQLHTPGLRRPGTIARLRRREDYLVGGSRNKRRQSLRDGSVCLQKSHLTAFRRGWISGGVIAAIGRDAGDGS